MKETFDKIFKKIKAEFMTIPNMLSLLRFCLIPVIVYLYCVAKNNLWALIVIVFSNVTDIVDGFIARRFNMITDFGKFLDPVADKLTQFVVMICLVSNFRLMLLPVIVLFIKEACALIFRFIVFSKTSRVDSANWHGKAATTVLASVMMLHLFWYDIHPTLSDVLIILSAAMILLSLILYAVRNFGYILGKRKD